MNPNEPPAFASPSQRPLSWWQLLVATFAYAGSIQLGYLSAYTSQTIASIWPASGVAIWLVLRFGPRMFFVIGISEFALLWTYVKFDFSWTSLALSPLSACGNIAAAYIGARCVRHGQSRWTNSIGEFAEPASYGLAALVSSTVSASIGISGLILRGILPLAAAPHAWLGWWTSDVVGVLFLLPLLAMTTTIGLKWRHAEFPSLPKGLALLAATIGVCVLSFIPRQGNAYLFTIFPLLILATGWFDAVGVRLVSFLVAVAGIVAATRGHGPFVSASINEDLLVVQLFLCAIAIIALTLPPVHHRLNLLRRSPLAILLTGWVLSSFLYIAIQRQQSIATTAEFSGQTALAEASIRERLGIYTDAMRSAVSFLYASDVVRRDEWTTFAETLNLPGRYPGITGLGVIFRVPHADLREFVASVRADGAPDFAARGISGELTVNGQDHYLVTYFNPLPENPLFLGLDLTSETVRRETAEAAQDSGKPRLSGPIALQNVLGKQTGLLLLQPVYRKGAAVTTLAERRAALQAWISAPLLPAQFFSDMPSLRDGNLILRIFAGESTDPRHLLFNSAASESNPAKFTQINSIELVGQKFTLEWSPGPKFVATQYSPLVWLALSFAVATALLVGWLLNLQIFRERAENLVVERTAALRKNEDLLLRTAAIANVGGWELNLDTKKLFWSHEMCHIHELDPPVAPALDQVIHFTATESRPLVQAAMTAAIEHGTPWDMEVPLITAKGRAIWVRAQGTATMQQGRVIELHGIVQDITARKQAESAQTKVAGRLALAVRVGGVGIWEFNVARDELIWDEQMYRLYGIPLDEFSGTNEAWKNAVHPDDAARVDAEVQLALRGEKEFNSEFRVRWRNGSIHSIRALAFVQRDLQGQPLYMVGTNWDITAQKETEYTLLESQTRLQLIFEKVPIGLNLTRIVNGRRSSLRNPEHIRITGVSEKDGMNPENYHRRTPPEDLKRQLEGYGALQRGETDNFAMEKRYLHPGGRVVWVVITWLRRNTELPGDYFELSTVTDITERKLAEVERQQFDRKLQDTQKLESLGVLAGGIAHDFNNILTGILGNASLASRDLSPDSPLQQYLETIKKGSLRAADLCKQMLAYSGKGRFVVKHFTLNQLVEETTHLLKISISKKAVLRFNLHATLPPIEADATQIRQVIMNLVINASEAIGEKSGVISLHTGLTRVDRAYLGGTLLAPELPEGTYVFLEVADTGCGMSAETQSKIFDPFFTTKFTGRGLGLAAVLGIVRGHKGALKIYSELGRGTTFKVLFPCASGSAELLAPAPAPQTAWRGQGCVLVVDDEESIRATASLMLRKMGFETALAADGRDAVAAFRAEPDRFALVLMDLTMPHLDGEQAFTEMRQIRPNARVVLMSGFNEQEAISRFTNRGLASFLQKPFAFDSLSETMQRVSAIEPT